MFLNLDIWFFEAITAKYLDSYQKEVKQRM